MGQKTIPQSLRIDHFKNWSSDWEVDKKDYSKFLYFDYTVRQYLQNFCLKKTINLSKINIIKNNRTVNIYLTIYNFDKYENSSFVKKIENFVNNYIIYLNLHFFSKIFLINSTIPNLNLHNHFLKKYKKFPLIGMIYYDFINLSYIAFYLQSSELINKHLVTNLRKLPKHRQYLFNIDKILKKQFSFFPNCIGYRIQFKGRLNGYKRSKKMVIKSGKAPLNTINTNIKYNFSEVLTPYGICSLKTFLFYKK